MQSGSNIIYRINGDDLIVFVNEAWDRFALRNDAPDLVGANVLERSLWDFIDDETTCQLYKDILAIVRTGKILHFNFNCDSPDRIRFMEMIISAEKNGGIQFQTKTLQTRARPPESLLDRNARRTQGFLHICSWCKAIETGQEEWKDVEEAISILDLFKRDKLPHLTHGICDSCYLRISEKITERKAF